MTEEKYIPSKESDILLDGYRLLDDEFMTVFFNQNIEAATLVLRIILKKNDILIKTMQVQKIEKSADVVGRDVILDIFAVDAEGKNYDIEIQRADRGAGRKRARFLSSVLDSRMLKSGQDFSEIGESYVIFITEKDVLKGGLPVYQVHRTIEELEQSFDDGNHIIYVNAAYKNDETDIGRLMHDFRCTSSVDMFYDVLREGMYHYKETEGGRATMSKALEEYGQKKEMRGVIKLGRDLGLTDEQIISKLVDFYKITKEAAKELLTPVAG